MHIENFTEETMKASYESPHVVGTFMSHWHLLRLVKAGWEMNSGVISRLGGNEKKPSLLPDALFVFEHDAKCAENTHEVAAATIKQLPEDWDMLFIGGKPFMHMENIVGKDITKDSVDEQLVNNSAFERMLCQGELGNSASGPFAPDGSNSISADQPYWKM